MSWKNPVCIQNIHRVLNREIHNHTQCENTLCWPTLKPLQRTQRVDVHEWHIVRVVMNKWYNVLL